MATMTEQQWPRVTVVLVTALPIDDERVKQAIYSVQEQDYPKDLVDLNICLAEHITQLDQVRRAGVKGGTTEMAVFAHWSHPWEPSHLSTVVMLETHPEYKGPREMFNREDWLVKNV